MALAPIKELRPSFTAESLSFKAGNGVDGVAADAGTGCSMAGSLLAAGGAGTGTGSEGGSVLRPWK
jgi:hypothetical protein